MPFRENPETGERTYYRDSITMAAHWVDGQHFIDLRRKEIESRLFRESTSIPIFPWRGEPAGISTYTKRRPEGSESILFDPEPLKTLLGKNLVAFRCIPFCSVVVGEAVTGSDIDMGTLITENQLTDVKKKQVIQNIKDQGFRVSEFPSTTIGDDVLYFHSKELGQSENHLIINNGYDLITGTLPYAEEVRAFLERPDINNIIKTETDFNDVWWYFREVLPPRVKKLLNKTVNSDQLRDKILGEQN